MDVQDDIFVSALHAGQGNFGVCPTPGTTRKRPSNLCASFETEERCTSLLCPSSQFASATVIFGAYIVQVAMWDTWENPTLHATLHAYSIQS